METQTNGVGKVAAPQDVGHRGLVEGFAPTKAPELTWEMSAECAEIFAALSKAQGEIRSAAKGAENDHFGSSYADLDAVWDACREPLSKNGIAVVQMPKTRRAEKACEVIVRCLLAHASGQWVSCELTMEVGDLRPQTVGSAITYGRRYTLAPMVGVAPRNEDDDGEAAEGRPSQRSAPRQPARAAAPKPHVHPSDDGTASEAPDWQRIKHMLTAAPDADPPGLGLPIPKAQAWLLGRFGVEAPSDLTLAQCRCAETLLLAKQKGDKPYKAILAGLIKDGWVRGDETEASS